MNRMHLLRCTYEREREGDSDESGTFTDSDSDSNQAYSIPDSLSDEDTEPEELDADQTLFQFTAKPVPGYQEVDGDLFQCRKQRRKGHTYALAHCISADATMGAGIAVTFCNHFEGLRSRVESEAHVKATLIPIYLEEDDCWAYNLVTKSFHYDKPTRRDFHESLIKRRVHAITNSVAEIHMPRLAAGIDRLNWNITKEMILDAFREKPIKITVYTPRKPLKLEGHNKLNPPEMSTLNRQDSGLSSREPERANTSLRGNAPASSESALTSTSGTSRNRSEETSKHPETRFSLHHGMEQPAGEPAQATTMPKPSQFTQDRGPHGKEREARQGSREPVDQSKTHESEK